MKSKRFASFVIPGGAKNCFDVIVAGSGMAGLGAALALASLNRKVLIITKKKIKGESSPAAGGILDPLLEMKPSSFFLSFCLRAFRAWPSELRTLEKQTGLKVGYQASGVLYAALSNQEKKILAGRYRWQKNLDIKTQWLNREGILKKEPLLSPNVQGGIFYPEIGRVQPRRLLKVLIAAARKLNVRFCYTDKVPQIKIENKKVVGVKVGNVFYSSPFVVNATGSWAGTRKGIGPAVAVKPARGQILILKKENLKIKNILHTVDGGYIVPWDKNSLLIGSTVEFAGFNPEVTSLGRKVIREKNQRLVPSLAGCKEIDSWAGLRPFPQDRYPLIGPTRISGLFMAAGYYRSGILIGLYAGKLLARGIVSGKMPSELKSLDPRRFDGT